MLGHRREVAGALHLEGAGCRRGARQPRLDVLVLVWRAVALVVTTQTLFGRPVYLQQ
ncbi:hypothetical protein ABZX93_27410 [Streptomyces sp. NPDC006632]|uniref:hypothetical protein n=1 Tax=unclassified Streptomyces TaxID=2593676 RepID=UPI002E250703